VSTSQNKIRALPPRTAESALGDLDKLNEWTEQPSKQAASAITAPVDTVAQKAEIKPASAGLVTMTTRYPADIAARVRFYAGTHFGVTVNSFLVDAAREKLERES
jgi:hypothetical protein